VVDVQNTQVIALRSSLTVVVSVTQSQALSGLAISLLEEHYGEVARWIKRGWELGC